jgi:hypothetical protein
MDDAALVIARVRGIPGHRHRAVDHRTRTPRRRPRPKGRTQHPQRLGPEPAGRDGRTAGQRTGHQRAAVHQRPDQRQTPARPLPPLRGLRRLRRGPPPTPRRPRRRRRPRPLPGQGPVPTLGHPPNQRRQERLVRTRPAVDGRGPEARSRRAGRVAGWLMQDIPARLPLTWSSSLAGIFLRLDAAIRMLNFTSERRMTRRWSVSRPRRRHPNFGLPPPQASAGSRRYARHRPPHA